MSILPTELFIFIYKAISAYTVWQKIERGILRTACVSLIRKGLAIVVVIASKPNAYSAIKSKMVSA